MSAPDKFIAFAKAVLPMPFTIAVLLTAVTIACVFIIDPSVPPAEPKYEVALNGISTQLEPAQFKQLQEELNLETAPVAAPKAQPKFLEVLGFWEKGFWGLLEFTMQMVLILVLGHALALTPFVRRLIGRIAGTASNTASAAAIVSFAAMCVGFINWGLGLIFGAILARKVAEHAAKHNIKLNFPLIAAAGYTGMMVWHGGFSGSAPLKVTEPGHFLEAQIGIIPPDFTLFSNMNIIGVIALLLIVPLVLFLIGKNIRAQPVKLNKMTNAPVQESPATGAEKLDRLKLLGYLLGGTMVVMGIYKAATYSGSTAFSFLTLNYVNFMLFGLGLVLHGSFYRYVKAIDEAVGGASGIIIQFPLYAGIMGIMNYSGLIHEFSQFFISISTSHTLPIFTFISAGLVNIFVPSGGGQWAVQGPIVVQSALDVGVPVAKNIMALAYGDQITNMIQPFWALPLLAITGLDAKDILPFSFIIMLVGLVIFLSLLLLF